MLKLRSLFQTNPGLSYPSNMMSTLDMLCMHASRVAGAVSFFAAITIVAWFLLR